MGCTEGIPGLGRRRVGVSHSRGIGVKFGRTGEGRFITITLEANADYSCVTPNSIRDKGFRLDCAAPLKGCVTRKSKPCKDVTQ